MDLEPVADIGATAMSLHPMFISSLLPVCGACLLTDIQRRIARLEQRVQYASANRYGRYDRYGNGYNGYNTYGHYGDDNDRGHWDRDREDDDDDGGHN